MSNELRNDGPPSGTGVAPQPALTDAYENSFGPKRSQVQILSPRPVFILVRGIFVRLLLLCMADPFAR